MSVPKYRRNKSKVLFFDNAYKIVEDITKYLLCDFGCKKTYSNLKVFTYKAKMEKEDLEDFEYLVDKYHLHTETSYPEYILDFYRTRMLNLMNDLIETIGKAYTMYPNSMYEFNIRRQYQTDAISICQNLLHTLQLAIKIFPSTLEKYTKIVDNIAKEIDLLKNWRKDSNKLRPACARQDEERRLRAINEVNRRSMIMMENCSYIMSLVNMGIDFSYDTLISNLNNTRYYWNETGLHSTLYAPAITFTDSQGNITGFGLD